MDQARARFLQSEKPRGLMDWDEAERGLLAPLAVNPYTGRPEPAVPGLLHAPWRAAREAATGAGPFAELQRVRESGWRPSPELAGRAMDIGGGMMLGSMPMGAPANSVGMFAGPRAVNLTPLQERAYEGIARGLPEKSMLDDAGIEFIPGIGYGHGVSTADWGMRIGRPTRGAGEPLDKVLDAPGLYAAYPRLRMLRASVNPMWEDAPNGMLTSRSGMPALVEASASGRSGVLNLLRHEVGGHAVDKLEGRGLATAGIDPRTGQVFDEAAYLGSPAEISARMASNAPWQGFPSSRRYAAVDPWRDHVFPESDKRLADFFRSRAASMR